MAILEVGSSTQRTSKTTASHTANLAFPGNVTAGNLLLVMGSVFRNDAAVALTVTGTRCTFTVLKNDLGDVNDQNFIAYGIATSSGAETVTVDMGGTDAGDTQWFAIDEFSGVHATPLSVDGGVTNNTSTTQADSVTTVTANELVVGVMTTDSPDTSFTPDAGWTEIAEQESHAVQSGSAVFQIVTTAQSYSVSWTLGASRNGWVQTASFKASTGTVALSGSAGTSSVGTMSPGISVGL